MIDAVSHCLNFEPTRFKRSYNGETLAKWNRGIEPTKAQNDFTVL